MFHKVEVRSQTGQLLTLNLEDVSNGYLTKDIAGLDPVKANLVFSSFALLDGVQYQASSRDERNIVIKLGYEPDFVNTTVATLRENLYRFFMPKSFVKMRFFDDLGRTVDTAGRVETMDSPLFAQEPEATISILCEDPDFYDLIPSTFSGMSTSGASWIQHEYEGSVDTGFLFELTLNRALSAFTLKRQITDGTIATLDFLSPVALASGDIVRISTTPGNKFVRVKRGANEFSSLYAMSPKSVWPWLVPGMNNIRVEAAGAALPFKIDYVRKYGGL